MALVALLPKSTKKERPIALLHFLYRSYIRLRWDLIASWQCDYSRIAGWDKALPGSQVLDVALGRLMRGEATRQASAHMVTLFLDLENFYDRCRFGDMLKAGLDLGYPPLILHQAWLVYSATRFAGRWGDCSTDLAKARCASGLSRGTLDCQTYHSPDCCIHHFQIWHNKLGCLGR